MGIARATISLAICTQDLAWVTVVVWAGVVASDGAVASDGGVVSDGVAGTGSGVRIMVQVRGTWLGGGPVAAPTAEQEVADLKAQAGMLQEQLDLIQARMGELSG